MTQTYVIGYWHVAGNSKRSTDHYRCYLPRTFDYLAGSNLILLSNSTQLIDYAKQHVQSRFAAFDARFTPLEDLPKSRFRPDFIQAAQSFLSDHNTDDLRVRREKANGHCNQLFAKSGARAYGNILTVWHSKVDLVQRIAAENPFQTDRICWVDASAARFHFKRAGWDFVTATLDPELIYTYTSNATKRLKRIDMNASIISVPTHKASAFAQAYDSAFATLLPESYPNDEEITLSYLKANNAAPMQLFSKDTARRVTGPGQWWGLRNVLRHRRLRRETRRPITPGMPNVFDS